MRCSQFCEKYTLVELKSLAEYCANIDGYSEQFIPHDSEKGAILEIQDSTSPTGDISRAIYQIVRRIPAANLHQFTEHCANAYAKTSNVRCICDIFGSEEFKSFLYSEECIDLVCNNEYVKDHSLTPKKYAQLLEVIYADVTRYDNYLLHLYDEMLKCIATMYIENKPILAMYCRIPQLRNSLINSARLKKHKFMLEQGGMVPFMLSEFESYMNKVTFDPSENESTVIECYIGTHMQYFLISWYNSLSAKYTTSKIVLEGGANEKLVYSSDLIKAKPQATARKSALDLYEIFEKTTKLDRDLFGAKKNLLHQIGVPYKSIVDFVIDQISADSIRELNNLLHTCTATYGMSYNLLQAYDTTSALKNTDQSFQKRISRAYSLIELVYRNLGVLDVKNVTQTCHSIANDNNSTCAMKDSDTPILQLSRITNNDLTFSYMTDELYSIVSGIIENIGNLFELERALNQYNSSLAYVWSTYTNLEPDRSCALFSTQRTIPDYLSHVLAKQQIPVELLHDEYGAEVPEFFMHINAELSMMFKKVLRTPYAQELKYADSKQIGNAKLTQLSYIANTAPKNPADLIDKSFKGLSQIKFEHSLSEEQEDYATFFADLLGIVEYNNEYRTILREDYDFSEGSHTLNSFANEAIKEIAKDSDRFKLICECASEGILYKILINIIPKTLYFPGTNSKLQQALQNIPSCIATSDIKLFSEIANIAAKFNESPEFQGVFNLNVEELMPEEKDMFALYSQLYIACAVLWISVYEAQYYAETDHTLAVPISDINLISDIGYAIIITQVQLDKTFITQMGTLKQLKEFCILLTRDNHKTMITKSTLLQEASFEARNIKTQYFDYLQECSNARFSSNSSSTAIESFTSKLSNLIPDIEIPLDFRMYEDQNYSDLVTRLLGNSLLSYMSFEGVASVYSLIQTLVKSRTQYNNYIKVAMKLDSCTNILLRSRKTRTIYSEDLEELVSAKETGQYKACKLAFLKSSVDIRTEFGHITRTAEADTNEFLFDTRTGEYITKFDSDENMYYLTADGVWMSVYYVCSVPKVNIMAYSTSLRNLH